MDNLFASRKYFYLDSVIKIVKDVSDFTCSNLKGTSEIDDTELLLNTKYGKEIYGPTGEIRIIGTKIVILILSLCLMLLGRDETCNTARNVYFQPFRQRL